MHTELALCPVKLLYEPAAHGVHTDAPAALQVPTGHVVAALTPDVQKLPAGHCALVAAVAPATQKLPALHVPEHAGPVRPVVEP